MSLSDKQIVARVERVVFPKDATSPDASVLMSGLQPRNPAAQFYILRCDVGTVKGKISHFPKQGETLLLDGKWEVSKYNGQPEFVFFHSSVYIPKDERSMLRYACEMTKGFGAAMEERIWAARGSDWRNVASSDVPGLSPRLLLAFQDTISFIATHEAQSKAVAWLLSIGLTPNMAERAFEKWKNRTIEKVQENPYILADLPHYGFRDVDTHIRDRFAIGKNDTRRIDACVSYHLAMATQEDTVADWVDLFAAVTKSIDSDPALICERVRAKFDAGSLVAFPATQRLARLRDYNSESAIADFVRRAAALPRVKAKQPPDRAFDLDADQMAAVQSALDNSFSIINGGAGCGKTSLVKAVIHSLGGKDVELCAFAGKAAARLKEATGFPAATIHKMLEYMGEEFGFTRISLEGFTVIVDEASMVASDLMAEIVRRRPARLVLVGDEAQLPPVGSGQPFHDIIRLFPGAVSTLTTCYRNREAVYQSALEIRAGRRPLPDLASASERWTMTDIRNPRDAHARVLDSVRREEIDFDTDIILCCRNGEGGDDGGDCSVNDFNRDIKDIVNPNPDGSSRIAPGDRIINTKNQSDLDVWNGTTGRCRDFDTAGAMWVDLDFPRGDGSSEVLIPKDKLKDWRLAYALTVHKSQGSQYRKVVFVCSARDRALLSRPMAYTAVTRAKSECRVVGDLRAFDAAIRTVPAKKTVLQELCK